MDETQTEEEVEYDLEESDELDTDSDATSEQDQEDEQPKRKPNLVKKLRDELKQKNKLLAQLQQKETKLDASTEAEMRIFALENPDAKDFKDGIRSTLARFPDMSMEEALAYAKATAPKVSQSKREFDFKSKQKPQDVSQMDDDEASEKLSPTEYLQYTRSKGSQYVKPVLGRK